MKKILGIIFIFAIFLTMGNAYAAAGSGLDVSIPKYEPYPVESGNYFDLWVKVQNVGSADLKNAEVSIIPTYPFSIDSTAVDVYSTGIIRGGQEEIYKFKIRVDDNAVEGPNMIKVQSKYGTFDPTIQEFEILVQTRDAILGVVDIQREPESFVPGQVSMFTVTLENFADSVLSDIRVNLDLTTETLPFTTMSSTSEKSVYLIQPGEQVDVSFDILTFPSAESMVYKIPVEISYYDNIGTKYTKDEVFGFIVGDTPLIELLLDQTTIKKSGVAGTVNLELINRGLTDIKFLTIELQGTDDFEIISNEKIYIGGLDSDDTDSFEMNIFVKSTNKDSITLPIHLQYLDTNNKAYDVIENVELKLYSTNEISRYGLGSGDNGFGNIIVLVILAVIGWFAYNKWFKKR